MKQAVEISITLVSFIQNKAGLRRQLNISNEGVETFKELGIIKE